MRGSKQGTKTFTEIRLPFWLLSCCAFSWVADFRESFLKNLTRCAVSCILAVVYRGSMIMN